MKQVIQIRCKNNKKSQKVEIGSTLFDIFSAFDLKMTHGPVSARVNNKVEGMHYRVYNSKDVEFLDMTSSSGSRAYTRTLFFVLCKAVQDIYPATDVVIDIPVSNGFYVDIRLGRPVVDEDVNIIRRRMQEIIDARMPIRRFTVPTEEAVALFQEKGDVEKVKLLKTSGSIYTTYYKIGDYVDYYYGTLLTNTSQLYLFGLEKYYDGMLLRIPSLKNPDVLGEMTRQDKDVVRHRVGVAKHHSHLLCLTVTLYSELEMHLAVAVSQVRDVHEEGCVGTRKVECSVKAKFAVDTRLI